MGSAGCYWGLYVGSWVSGCCIFRGWVGVWGGGGVLTGFFRWVFGCGEGSGLVESMGIGDIVCSFVGGC